MKKTKEEKIEILKKISVKSKWKEEYKKRKLQKEEEEGTPCCGWPYVEDELGLCSNPECREHV